MVLEVTKYNHLENINCTEITVQDVHIIQVVH